MDYGKDLAVQSYCFRGFKANSEVVEKVKAIGLASIELCGVHVDFANESTFDDIIGLYCKAGVKICSIGVQGFSGKAEVERKWFEFAKRAGATTISATFALDAAPNCYRVAEKLADEYNINLAIHNHGGRHWLGSAEMLNSVFKQTSARIGLMLDTAWALHSHEDPVAWVEKFGGRLYGVHVKDFTFDRAGKHQDVVVGTGNLDMPKLFAAMKKVNFSGNLILEYEGDVNDPVPALKECVAAVRAIKV
jgi:sugar phosphate isomerase/epimerase